MEENGWGGNLIEQVDPGKQLVRINVIPNDKTRPLTRQATIDLLGQFGIPYQISTNGHPLVMRKDADRIDSNYYKVSIIN